MSGPIRSFGIFQVDVSQGELRKRGVSIRIQRKPFQLLVILLERPGEIVTREELRQQLWPADTFVEFDQGLNGAMKKLRIALGDSPENPRFIETVPRLGYRFIAPLQPDGTHMEAAAEALATTVSAAAETGAEKEEERQAAATTAAAKRVSAGRLWSSAMLVAGCALLVAGLYYLKPLAPLPQVTHIAKLSSTGRAWQGENLMTDGARVYYTAQTEAGGYEFRQILLNGNGDAPVEGLPPDSLIRAMSPDHTTFLFISQAAAAAGEPSPVWSVPVVEGAPRRVGDLKTNDFAFSPDGRELTYARGSQLFIGGVDGSGGRVVATVAGTLICPRWSPGGHRIRFTVLDQSGGSTIWEVGADGTGLQRLEFDVYPGVPVPMEGFGDWTPDGRYYVFTSRREGISDLWAMQDGNDWMHRQRTKPVQLTAGPINYYRPLVSRDGQHIFALGREATGELVRYDARKKDFEPFLVGLSADHLDFTHDGQWVTYVAYPEGTLWRARSDGTQALQLTFAPLRTSQPRWSPDGKKILFVGTVPGGLPKIYTISPEGGNAEPVYEESHGQGGASWSPDGETIYYGRAPDTEAADLALYRFNVRTGQADKIAGTEGFFSPACSPDGSTLAALSQGTNRRLVLVNLQTGNHVQLNGRSDYPIWSADGQYVYFNRVLGGEPAIFRVHVADGKEEKVVDVHFPTTGIYGVWSGLAPDGSPIILRAKGETDVYALTLELH